MSSLDRTRRGYAATPSNRRRHDDTNREHVYASAETPCPYFSYSSVICLTVTVMLALATALNKLPHA